MRMPMYATPTFIKTEVLHFVTYVQLFYDHKSEVMAYTVLAGSL